MKKITCNATFRQNQQLIVTELFYSKKPVSLFFLLTTSDGCSLLACTAASWMRLNKKATCLEHITGTTDLTASEQWQKNEFYVVFEFSFKFETNMRNSQFEIYKLIKKAIPKARSVENSALMYILVAYNMEILVTINHLTGKLFMTMIIKCIRIRVILISLLIPRRVVNCSKLGTRLLCLSFVLH